LAAESQDSCLEHSILRNFKAFCLGVIGFTNPPAGEALVARTTKQVFRALGVGNL
jgi:hypothetical protein